MNFKVFILVAYSVIVLGACTPDNNFVAPAKDSVISFEISPLRPKAEQPFIINLTIVDDLQPGIGRMEGLNMNMGYLPVVWTQVSDQHWQANMMVGICAEPVMNWRVTVPLYETSGAGEPTQVSTYQFEFFTDTF